MIVLAIDQEEIANTLDKVTELISLRQQQLEKLDQLVKSRFVEMFGNPITNPFNWEKAQLQTYLLDIENGKSIVCSTKPRQGEWPAILKLSAATYGEYRPEENKALLDDGQYIESVEVHKGDLLFTRKNTPELVGMAAYVRSTPAKLMMPDLVFRINTKEQCTKVFLWQLINHKLFRTKIQELATGSAKSMSNISKERLMKLEVYMPPIELQNCFATFVTQIDKSKFKIQQSLEKLETLKKALMQKYFG
ncbi:MAG: restriction endonuclease subunit S [Oscillibacter sp.]|nr:restriction endonuclease subunit S [Oscillibacter sp.]